MDVTSSSTDRQINWRASPFCDLLWHIEFQLTDPCLKHNVSALRMADSEDNQTDTLSAPALLPKKRRSCKHVSFPPDEDMVSGIEELRTPSKLGKLREPQFPHPLQLNAIRNCFWKASCDAFWRIWYIHYFLCECASCPTLMYNTLACH